MQSGSVGGPEALEKSHSASRKPKLSLREFLDDSGAKRNPDKMLVIGEYLIESEKMPEFSREDVRSRFRAAGEALPGNFHRDFTLTITNGWIAEEHGKTGSFYVTQKGKNAIAQKFPAEPLKVTKARSGGRKKTEVESE